jgi:hypothetical protein
LSSDTVFNPSGQTLRIPYQKRHGQYTEWINVGLAKQNLKVVALIEEWNTLFFPHGYRSSCMSHGEEDSDSDFEQSMQRIRGDEN